MSVKWTRYRRSGFLKAGAMVPADGHRAALRTMKKDPISKIVLQNVKVAAAASNGKPKNERGPQRPLVTLQSAEQAENWRSPRRRKLASPCARD